MENRDFKGIWIPKEIWLCKDLSALDRIIYAEIDSLDGENHCTASNSYFADFCGVGVATVTRSIAKLEKLGYIDVQHIEGEYRVIKVSRHPNQNDEGSNQNDEGQPLTCNKYNKYNIYNNINNKDLSNNIIPIKNRNYTGEAPDSFDGHCYSNKELKQDFIGSIHRKPKIKKKNLYEKCVDEVYSFTPNLSLQDALLKYLQVRLSIIDKPMYGVNQWKCMLAKLNDFAGDKVKIVEQSTEKGWCSFYELKTDRQKNVFSEGDGVYCESAVDTEEERAEKLRKQGRRDKF